MDREALRRDQLTEPPLEETEGDLGTQQPRSRYVRTDELHQLLEEAAARGAETALKRAKVQNKSDLAKLRKRIGKTY